MQANQLIHNYRLLRFIAQGGMGEVWQAEHLYLSKTVAIKRLHPSLARDAAVRRRFKQEAATLAYLDHPNIVRLHDYLEDPDEVYLVMEYVEGVPLDEWINKTTGPIPELRAADLLRQILDGVGYAHAQGIIHRDIKPSNFLITPDLQVKILDFGIAHAIEGDMKLTKTGARLGTVLYMSPEQVQGHAIDLRSDIYAIGVTLFQMLTGQCPYRHDATEFHVFDQIVNHPLPRAASFYPMVSPHMQYLIDKATAKSPQQRFQNCAEFFETMIGATPVAGAPTGGVKSTQAPVQTPAAPAQEIPLTKAEQRAAKIARRAEAAAASPGRRPFFKRMGVWLGLAGLAGILLLLGVIGYFAYWRQYQRIHMSPDEVAEEFLTALVDGDAETARLYAQPNCDRLISVMGSLRGQTTKDVVIERTERTGLDAIVYYHFEGEKAGEALRVDWDSKGWRVHCTD
jgi:tRNA A-37 threonylcarbamoyl transferase component Bud32